MNNKVTVIDYGMGNLHSIKRAIEHVGGDPEITDDLSKVTSADRLLLPGVGAFGTGISTLREMGMMDAVYSFCEKERPLLGICLGMQLLFKESFEFGHHTGLNLIQGKVIGLEGPQPGSAVFKIPHIGWNMIDFPTNSSNPSVPYTWQGTIFDGLTCGKYFYFVHSFICIPDNSETILAESLYGHNRFCSAVVQDNLWGCQFHPEKSGVLGLHIYKNFLNGIL